MSYRPPDELKANEAWLKECMRDAVSCGLDECMPDVMITLEECMIQKFEELKTEIVTMVPGTPPVIERSYRDGMLTGSAFGLCLLIGLLTGLFVGTLL